MIEILMPRLSDSMEEGVIISWLAETGSTVSAGDDLVEIETDKANMTYEADADGRVHHLAGEGDVLPVGAPIAQLLQEGEKPLEGRTADLPSVEEPPSPVAEPPAAAAESPSPPGKRIRSSPLARRIAAELGIELSGLSGSGPHGRITKGDILAAEHQQSRDPSALGTRPPGTGGSPSDPDATKGVVETVELSRLQRTVARRMVESKQLMPHFYLSSDVDMTNCIAARNGIKSIAPVEGIVPSYNDMVIKACALALRELPKANGSYLDDRIELYSRINIGMAVAADGALVVPVVADADRKGLGEIATDTRGLAAKVRDGSITPPELSGGTFTVSNLGMLGVGSFDAVINPGQAAILAVGAIEERPVARNGEVVPASMMTVTLSCDHRILYGAEGANLLARVKSILEQPFALAL